MPDEQICQIFRTIDIRFQVSRRVYDVKQK